MDKDFSVHADQPLIDYVYELFSPLDDLLKEVKETATREGLPTIQVAPMDGLHLEVLTRIAGAKKAVEIGTLGGYSGICILRGMGPDGHLDTFEISERNAFVAHRAFERAGLTPRVRIHVGPALENLKLIEKNGPFDLVFIDADKGAYPDYLRWAAQHLKKGGLVIGDNTFAFGKLARPPQMNDEGKSVEALRAFNQIMAQSGLFRSTIIPTGEGLTVGVKL